MLQHQFLTSKTYRMSSDSSIPFPTYLAWCISGKSNECLMQSNMKGVLTLQAENQRRGLEDFADPVADCDLVDLPLYGASWTWSNMRKGKEMEIRCRLDLFLIDSDWEDHLQDTIQKVGTTFASDHDLILLFYFEQLPSTVPFSFELMWLSLSKSRTQSCEAKECNILLTWYNIFPDY